MDSQNPIIDSQKTSLVAAAVLVPLCFAGGELSLLFTKRTEKVSHHKGQVCFPGGVRDSEDETLWQTALREVGEELGLPPETVSYVCELPTLTTPTGFIVTPFVAGLSDCRNAVPNADEIAEVFAVPMAFILDQNNVRFESRDYFGVAHRVPFITYGKHEIWGATGKMALSLADAFKEEPFRDRVRRVMGR